MKKLITILSFLLCGKSFATTYYVALSGNDANAGTSTGAAWKTLAKVNSFQASFVAGDNILLNRGDIFYGNLTLTKSGSAGNVITYGAYGSGANPVISGFNSTAISFSNLGGNIWESSSAVSTLSTCNMVVINGVNTSMGRIPQTGFYTITSATSTSITSASLNAAVTNWTGAQVVMKVIRDLSDRGTITSASGSTINYSGASNTPTAGYGFFIQNDVRTLTYQNAWYYNPSNKKIRIYSTSTPANVRVSIVSELVTASGRSYITFDGIDFTGSNGSAMHLTTAHHFIIQNCNFSFTGQDGIQGDGLAYRISPLSNTFTDCSNAALASYDGSNDSSWVITGNTVRRTGLDLGMRQTRTFGAIHSIGNDCLIQYNNVDSSGYSGVQFINNRVRCLNNFINHSCMALDDGAGIYTNGTGTQKVIIGNIVLNSVGSPDGTNQTTQYFGNGIYLDDNSSTDTVINNTCAGNSGVGILLHNAANNYVRANTCYDNYNIAGTGIARGGIYIEADAGSSTPTRNNKINANILFAKQTVQYSLFMWNQISVADAILYGTSDSNYFAKAIDTTQPIRTFIASTTSFFNLRQWRTFSSQDAHSNIAAVAITNLNQLFFAYNPNSYDSTITIPSGTWVNVAGTPYNTGSTILHAYTSIILISTGTNLPPIANAGTNKNITLPTSTITQVGSGSDPDGTISGYLWTQFSGPSTATIVSPTSATTVINALSVAGTYVFQLRVTDNLGATGTDTMSCVVNASAPPNQPPIVDAGGNKIITLPTSTIMQSGSATDPDGTISGYLWTQSGSNPTAANIVSPLAASTSIIGMTVAGVYSFTLTATDNLGATGSQTITVTVNAIVPVPPIVHAGVDQAITWPTNSVTLSGSATAGTGTIASYLWTKISGGIGTITNQNTASTTVTGLDIGVYLYQLTVTDNSGFQGKDTMQVTVSKGSASASYTIISVTYNASPQSIGIVTSPVGLVTNTTYDDIGTIPTNAKVYATVSNITDVAHWNSTPITGTFTINPAPGTFTVSNTTVQYDSLLHNVSVSTSNPAITYTISGAPQRYKNTYAVTVHNTNSNFSVTDANVTLTITAGNAPPLVWNPATPQTYPYALDGSVLNAGDVKGGVYHYTPLAGFVPSVGSLQLKVDFTPTDTNLAPIIGTTRTITINKGTDVMTASDTIQYADGNPKPITVTTLHGGTVVITYDGSTTTPPSAIGDHPYSAVYSDANWQSTTITGTLHILSNSAIIKITNFANRIFTGLPIDVTVNCIYPYTLVYTPSNHTDVNNNIQVIATISDGGVHTGADTAIMSIIKATPVGTWAAISPQTYIYTVQSGILNASTATAGTWAYNVSVGDTLVPGTYNLIGTFSPTDASNYNSITLTNSITVNKGSAVINVSGTSKQYNTFIQYITATTTPPNLDSLVIAYIGAHTDAGSYPFTAMLFSNLYTASTVSGTLTISQGSYTLSWATPLAIQSGTPLSAIQYNPSSSIPVTFTFNYPIGTILPTGITILTATAHPTDSVNYPVQTISVAISVYGQPVLDFFIKHGKLYPVDYPQ